MVMMINMMFIRVRLINFYNDEVDVGNHDNDIILIEIIIEIDDNDDNKFIHLYKNNMNDVPNSKSLLTESFASLS
jgi:hypothetical protein